MDGREAVWRVSTVVKTGESAAGLTQSCEPSGVDLVLYGCVIVSIVSLKK